MYLIKPIFAALVVFCVVSAEPVSEPEAFSLMLRHLIATNTTRYSVCFVYVSRHFEIFDETKGYIANDVAAVVQKVHNELPYADMFCKYFPNVLIMSILSSLCLTAYLVFHYCRRSCNVVEEDQNDLVDEVEHVLAPAVGDDPPPMVHEVQRRKPRRN